MLGGRVVEVVESGSVDGECCGGVDGGGVRGEQATVRSVLFSVADAAVISADIEPSEACPYMCSHLASLGTISFVVRNLTHVLPDMHVTSTTSYIRTG